MMHRLCVLASTHSRMLPYLVQRNLQMKLTRNITTAQIHQAQDDQAIQNNDDATHPKPIQNNPYLSKYEEKLKHLKESDPQLYKTKMEELAEKYREAAEQRRKDLQEQRDSAMSAYTKKRTLDGIMKQELLADKSPEEIEQIWTEFHKTKNCVFAVIPRLEYEEIHKRSLEHATFVYPVPRGAGYEFFMQHFDGHECHFTSLILYQRHKENAPPCLTLTHYTELMEDKGIVLMRGEPDTKFLSVHESQLLALQLKLYYGLQSGLKFNHVRLFSNSPEDFRYMDIVREFENYKKDYVEHMIEKV